MIGPFSKCQLWTICGIALTGLVVIAVCLGIFLNTEQVKYRGAVVTSGYECAEIGRSMIAKGGSAVDAAIAAMFCEGVAMPQSTGIGGGFFMTVYEKKTGSIRTLNAREVAPLASHKDMFEGNSSLSAKGVLSVAVPGELLGYWYAHQAYGVLKWEELVQPTIDLCRKGHLVTAYLAKTFKGSEKRLFNSVTLREVYIDPKTNKSYPEGHLLKLEKLGDTLETIAREGAYALYNGSLAEIFVEDVQNMGGIITFQDMEEYKPEWSEPIKVNLPDNQTLYTFPLPGSGLILTYILNILKGFLDFSDLNSVTNNHRIAEGFKYGYGKRTELGDIKFVPGIEKLITTLSSEDYAFETRTSIRDDRTYQDPKHYGADTFLVEDHGTAHISVLAPNGDAVSITGTINLIFGSEIRSSRTGIILNDEMDDFSAPNITNAFGIPPSPSNFIVPKKRPLSSMCPTIVLDKNGDVRMVIGAAGGTKITTAVATVAMRHLWFNYSVQVATDMKRYHHQLFPMSIEYEQGYDMELVKALQQIGHEYTITPSVDGFAAVTAISNVSGKIEGSADHRRSGAVAYIE